MNEVKNDCTSSRIRIGLGSHKIQMLYPEEIDDTFDFCTSCVEGSRDLFNQLLDSTPRGKYQPIRVSILDLNQSSGFGRSLRIGLGTHKIQTLFPEGIDDTFDFCTSCVEGSRDLFN